MSCRKFEPWNRELTAYSPRTQKDFVRAKLKTTLCFDCVRIDKVRASCLFMNRYSRGFQLRAKSRMPANVFDDPANAPQKTWIVEGRGWG
jgi:hypothetical protein